MENFCKNEEDRLKEFNEKLEEEKKKIDKEKFYYDRYKKRVVYADDVKKIDDKMLNLKPTSKPKYDIQMIMLSLLILTASVLAMINI